jgi:hypothetical protein
MLPTTKIFSSIMCGDLPARIVGLNTEAERCYESNPRHRCSAWSCHATAVARHLP